MKVTKYLPLDLNVRRCIALSLRLLFVLKPQRWALHNAVTIVPHKPEFELHELILLFCYYASDVCVCVLLCTLPIWWLTRFQLTRSVILINALSFILLPVVCIEGNCCSSPNPLLIAFCLKFVHRISIFIQFQWDIFCTHQYQKRNVWHRFINFFFVLCVVYVLHQIPLSNIWCRRYI